MQKRFDVSVRRSCRLAQLQPSVWYQKSEARKRPKKPLQLLALLASQGTKALPIDLAVESLWPSPDAEDPKASLEVALARLRKLVDLPGIVVVADGGLQFDGRMVWSDVAAFATLEQRWRDGRGDAREEKRVAALQSAQRALGLYRGALLEGEELPAPWARVRERWARVFSRLVIECGSLLESQGCWSDACEAYERGIAGDALSEPAYRALMRVQLQLGERAEVLRTFARCRHALEAALGVGPAPETWLLHGRAGGSPGDRV